MYGGISAADTEIMNDVFRRQQADRAQKNADRAFAAQQEQRGIENERADRAQNMQQQQYDRAQQNADRAFQLDVEKTNADLSFKEHESAWKDEVYKRNIAEADMRIEEAQRIADKNRAKAEADKQSADGFLYSASKILLGGGGERFSFGNGADGKPIFAMDVPIAGTNKKITIDDAFKLSSAQVESLRASGVPILGNVQNIIMHTNNDTGKKEFLIVNEDKSVTPMSEEQMYNASKSFGGQADADAIFGRSNETRQMETFKQQQDILHKNKMEELQTTRAVSAYTSFIKSMKDMGYDVEEINKMWDSPTNPIKKMLMGEVNSANEGTAKSEWDGKSALQEGMVVRKGTIMPNGKPAGYDAKWTNGKWVKIGNEEPNPNGSTVTPRPMTVNEMRSKLLEIASEDQKEIVGKARGNDIKKLYDLQMKSEDEMDDATFETEVKKWFDGQNSVKKPIPGMKIKDEEKKSKYGEDTVKELKRLYPNAKDEEIESGKWDEKIARIANLGKDEGTVNAIAEKRKNAEEIKKKSDEDAKINRSRMLNKQYPSIRAKAEEDAKREGVDGNWPQWKIDKRAKELLNERLEDYMRSIGMKRKFGGNWE